MKLRVALDTVNLSVAEVAHRRNRVEVPFEIERLNGRLPVHGDVDHNEFVGAAEGPFSVLSALPFDQRTGGIKLRPNAGETNVPRPKRGPRSLLLL